MYNTQTELSGPMYVLARSMCMMNYTDNMCGGVVLTVMLPWLLMHILCLQIRPYTQKYLQTRMCYVY